LSLVDDCERCSRLVSRPGDHLCAGCAEALGRDVREPFWGDFASHPDSKLLPKFFADIASITRDFERDLRTILRDFAGDVCAPFEDAAALRRERRRG
jgi:hypothetical protein